MELSRKLKTCTGSASTKQILYVRRVHASCHGQIRRWGAVGRQLVQRPVGKEICKSLHAFVVIPGNAELGQAR